MKTTGKIKEVTFDAKGKAILSLVLDTKEVLAEENLFDTHVSIEVKKYHKKRSLDANALAWVMLDKIAKKTGIPKDEIYKEEVKRIGGTSEVYCGKKEAVQALGTAWKRNGLGWQYDIMPSKLPGCFNIVLYYGSSSYDTETMSRFISQIMEDCRALDIDTTPLHDISLWQETA